MCTHTHWPWTLRSPLKVPSHSDTQSSCRICCGSGGTLLSCAVCAASKRAMKRRGGASPYWRRRRSEGGRERVQTMSFCSGGNAAVNFATPWKHISSDQEAPSECREVFLLSVLSVWCGARLVREVNISFLCRLTLPCMLSQMSPFLLRLPFSLNLLYESCSVCMPAVVKLLKQPPSHQFHPSLHQ